jgi:hypothetical protein
MLVFGVSDNHHQSNTENIPQKQSRLCSKSFFLNCKLPPCTLQRLIMSFPEFLTARPVVEIIGSRSCLARIANSCFGDSKRITEILDQLVDDCLMQEAATPYFRFIEAALAVSPSSPHANLQ